MMFLRQTDFVRDFLCRPFHFQWDDAFLLELTLHQYLLKLNSINWRQSIYFGPTHVLRITRQIQVERYCTTKILPHSNTKIFYASFNDFIISLLYLYTVTCYSSCSQYAVIMMKTFCLVPESKSMVSEQYFFIGCFDGLLWLAIQPIFSLTHFQPMFHF